MAKKVSAPSTQRSLDIAEIREDAVVLKDGTLRAVIAVSSINFALKSEEEQQAIVAGYVGFLNTLDFPLQIVIQSRRLDIAPYLGKLERLEKEQQNELLRVQMADYRTFVRELVGLGEIMTKSFSVVVPYSPLTDQRKGFWSRLREVLTPARLVQLKGERFRERREALDQRVERVVGALQSLGLSVVRLDTAALIETFYALYNPEVSRNEKLAPAGDMQVEG